MKIALAAAALVSLAWVGAADAAPTFVSASQSSLYAGADVIDAKFKFKKFGHSRNHRRSYGRGHSAGRKFGHRSFGRGFGTRHFGKGAFVKKGHSAKKFFFGRGIYLK